MTTRSHRAPSAARSPIRVGMLARKRLERQAREDAAVGATGGASGSRFDDETVETPTVQAIQAHANAYARREEQRFFAHIAGELTEYRVLVRALEADVDAYEDKTAGLSPSGLSAADREAIAGGRGPAFEEIRRLERRIRRGHHRADELSALIHSRFTAAKLRASRYYDNSDEKIAIYWGAFRRSSTTDRTGGGAPALRRADWLTAQENTKLLELWQGRTDAQA
ncbi:hypothetical protein [Leifsonia poae]|uniref:hypothetical protein n=1 Tax=Leifsonia poae TaxID=110933 RepID=UPI001CC07861|nr:hypothetical protein [Leifsonia poae]